MDCRDVRQLLPAWREDRLAQDDQALVQGHLGSCPACATEERVEARTEAVIGAALSDHPFGDEAVERMLRALPARASRAGPGRARGPGLGLGAAAAAALLLAGGLLLQPGSGGSPATVAEAPAQVMGHGTGLMRRTAAGGFEVLGAGAELRAGETLVAAETPARIELPDGSRVDLHADTELSLRTEADGGLTVALGSAGGEVFCEVARRSTPFRVSARNLDVEVMGTRFLVHQGARVSRVVVHQGAVLVAAHGQRRRLGPDDAAESRPDVEGLECLRVTALQHGLWVPRLAEEARAAALEHGLTTPPSAPPAPPAPVGTATPAGPIDPSLDVPVVPPVEQEPRLPGDGDGR